MLFIGLVTLGCISCVTSTIVVVPIKLQYFKSHDIYLCNYLNDHENVEHMMASSVVKKVGTKVAQFMGYNNLKLGQVQM